MLLTLMARGDYQERHGKSCHVQRTYQGTGSCLPIPRITSNFHESTKSITVRTTALEGIRLNLPKGTTL